MKKFKILIPVFNDWESLTKLLEEINFSIKDIYQATSGRNRIDNDFLNRKFNKIKINSQKIKKDDLFIAIKGLNFDGHDFIDEAFTNGAVAALISDKKRVSSNTILVNDTKKSLGDIATLILKKTSYNFYIT